MNEKFSLIGSGRIWGSFKTFVDREIRERRRGERQLAEQRATKHQLLARNSLSHCQTIPGQKFRGHQSKRSLTANRLPNSLGHMVL